jgi:hypothetical protein
MDQSQSNHHRGQALIEYLFIFAFVTFLSINIVKGLGKSMLSSVGYMGFELTEQFTIGVCKEYCFYIGYKNQDKGNK